MASLIAYAAIYERKDISLPMQTVLTNDSNALCKKLQFLIGAPEQYIDDFDAYNGIHIEVRRLCTLRSSIVSNFFDINKKFCVNHSLYDVSELISQIDDLSESGIIISVYHGSLSRQLMELNQLIDKRMEKLSTEFHPIPAEWIEELFHMPDGDTTDGVKNACIKFHKFRRYYPFQMYINFDFAVVREEQRSKNIFGNDGCLQNLLTEVHGRFCKLYSFIGAHRDVVVVVDCENSNPQRLYNCLRPALYAISKIILVNDKHSNALWTAFAEELTALGFRVEHVQIERLKSEKSLTDLKMVAMTCEEYYQNGIRSFVFASSDSDIWALVTGLPDADTMVLAERCKSSDALIDALTQNGIPSAFMEDVQKDSTELMDKVVSREMQSMIQKRRLEPRRIVLNVLDKLNLYPDAETFERYIKEAEAVIKNLYNESLPMKTND